jgi:hypothetical protein
VVRDLSIDCRKNLPIDANEVSRKMYRPSLRRFRI